MFFGAIRAYNHGGENRKPDSQQFQAALRKVLSDKNIIHGKKGNCSGLQPASNYCSYSNVSTISSKRPKKINSNDVYTLDDIEEVLKELHEANSKNKSTNGGSSKLTDLSDISTAYIASLIELNIINDKKVKCTLCKEVFAENEKLPSAFTSENHSSVACQSTFEICRSADYFIKIDILKGQYDIKLIFESIKSSINVDSLFQNTEFGEHGHDKVNLIDQILQKYIQYKARALGKAVDVAKYQKEMQDKRKEKEEQS